MEQKQHKHGLASVAWAICLLIGFAYSFVWIGGGRIFEGFVSKPIQWDLVGEGLMTGALFFIPVALFSWLLWTRRNKKMPSLAFVVTLIFGGFFFLLGLFQCITMGFASRSIEWDSVVMGLMITTMGISFFVVAWLLWFRPIIGGIALICQGIFLEILFGFEIQDLMDPKNPTMVILVGLPIVLGVFTLVREIMAKKGQATLKNAV